MVRKTLKVLFGLAFVLFLLWLIFDQSPVLDSIRELERLKSTEGPMNAQAADEKALITAPELDGGVGWLNVSRPLRMKEDLRGRIVLLDFWTYCCINCMHVIPELKELEEKYRDELVVIGVHSAKFNTEKDTANIRSAILRYEIEHPVVNDANFKIWNAYHVQSWPTLVLINPDGKIVGAVSGEGHFQNLDRVIGDLVNKYKGKLNHTPLPIALEKNKEYPSVLAYPGKVLADKTGGRLFIADTNHNRILISDLSGVVLDVVGKGPIGRQDGNFAEAEFHHPQGMTLVGNSLYVADTENHLLRFIDLVKKHVETVAGTGEQTFIYKGGPALQTGLNSPWDIVKLGEKFYFCNAGQHQLWVYDPAQKSVGPFAGSSRENIVDGAVKTAQLAQPSGITTDGTNLYFADSEVSAVRMVVMDRINPQVQTLVGKGLFIFGDKDGPYLQALLQHPLGVAWHDGALYIADTYNHKIKKIDFTKKQLLTVFGNGKPGMGSVEAPQFYEPGGLSFAGDIMYIADTNNNAIRRADMQTGMVETLVLDFSRYEQKRSAETFSIPTQVSRIQAKEAVPGKGIINVEFQFPSGYHLNPLAKPLMQYRLTSSSGKKWISPVMPVEQTKNELTIGLQNSELTDAKQIELIITYYYCEEGSQGSCYMDTLLVEGSVKNGNGTVQLNHTVAPRTFAAAGG